MDHILRSSSPSLSSTASSPNDLDDRPNEANHHSRNLTQQQQQQEEEQHSSHSASHHLPPHAQHQSPEGRVISNASSSSSASSSWNDSHHYARRPQHYAASSSSSLLVSASASMNGGGSFRRILQSPPQSPQNVRLPGGSGQVRHYSNSSSSSGYSNAALDCGGAGAGNIPDSRQVYVWTRISPTTSTIGNHSSPPPPPRSGAASVVVCGKLYIFGGYGGGTGRLDDFYCFQFDSQTWQTVEVLSTERPGCRENNGVVIADDSNRSIFLFGGYDGQNWLNDLWKFDIETKHWTCLQESTTVTQPQQPPVDDGTTGGGGYDNNDNNNNNANPNVVFQDENDEGRTLVDSHYLHLRNRADSSTNRRIVPGNVPSRRFGYVSVVHEGRFIVWGGFDGTRWLNDMYVYTFATGTWAQVLPPPSSPEGGSMGGSVTAASSLVWPSVRSCPAWAKDDQYVYIQGGYDGIERKSDFFALSLDTYEWHEMPCWGTPPSPRYFHSCGIHGNHLYLYGGYSGSERLADLYKYEFDTQHWSRIDARGGSHCGGGGGGGDRSPMNAASTTTAAMIPSGRSSLVLQVYEEHLYIFGGYNGSTVLNDFYKFRLQPIHVPQTSLVQDLTKLLQNPDLADVAFVVEGKVVFANRAILAIRSDYFRVMLCGGMRESAAALQPSSATRAERDEHHRRRGEDRKQKATTKEEEGEGHHHHLKGEEIDLPGVSYDVFLRVLEFIYTDTLRTGQKEDGFSLELAVHLLIASELFLLDRLKALCEDWIRRQIHVENVMDILVAAHRHNAHNLKDLSMEFILVHLHHPVVRDGLTILKSEPDLLVDIIKRHSSASIMATALSPPHPHHRPHSHLHNNHSIHSPMNPMVVAMGDGSGLISRTRSGTTSSTVSAAFNNNNNSNDSFLVGNHLPAEEYPHHHHHHPDLYYGSSRLSDNRLNWNGNLPNHGTRGTYGNNNNNNNGGWNRGDGGAGGGFSDTTNH